jgi:hypothetical protein
MGDIAESGIQKLALLPPNAAGAATISWSIALVDIDLNGKLDLVHADDQGAILIAKYGGIDRGYIHVFRNDGTGKFTDVTPAVGMNRQGQWMGLAFGDLNCDGHMDLFGSNFGDWALTNFPIPHEVGDFSSRWFLGRGDGTFSDVGVGELKATPFGWGVSMADYDNDGDTDIISYGGLDIGPYVEAGDAGTIYQNQNCTARFKYDTTALAGSTNHRRRVVQGLATGDLNGDGFVDIVTVSNADYPEPIPLARYSAEYGSPFDQIAAFVPTFRPVAQGEFVWNGFQATDGTLSVEINSGGNGNGWAAVKLRGSVGTIEGARSPRDGIGALVFFTPQGGKTVMRPVMGGGSYASQDSLEGIFGLGAAREGTSKCCGRAGHVTVCTMCAAPSELRSRRFPAATQARGRARKPIAHVSSGQLPSSRAAACLTKRPRRACGRALCAPTRRVGADRNRRCGRLFSGDENGGDAQLGSSTGEIPSASIPTDCGCVY